METAIFESVITAFAADSTEDFSHPFLKKVKFVLTDDQPNKNGQGIEYEDFPRIMQSAINAPIKMYFRHNQVGNHAGSVTIGHISSVAENTADNGIHQIIADGVLYADEFPQEVQYLEKSFAEGNSPGISWEIRYKDSILKQGINWLKGAITTAATFVKNPAYGTRTALLALASSDLDDEFLVDELLAIADSVSYSADNGTHKPPSGVSSAAKRALKWIEEGKAGANFTDVGRKRASDLARSASVSMDTIRRMNSFFSRHEVDKKAEGFNSGEKGFPSPGRVAWDAWGGDAGFSWVKGILKSEEAQAEIEETNKEVIAKVSEQEVLDLQKALEDAKAALTAALADNESLKATVASQSEVILEYKKSALAEERIRKITEAGIPLDAEKIEAKKDFVTALSEEAFAEYLSDLQAVQKASAAATQRAQASSATKPLEIPRLDGVVQDSATGIVELREKMRALRANAVATE